MALPNDNCRVCKCSLKTKYGTTCGRISTENLFKCSKRTGCEGSRLSDICAGVNIELLRDPKLYSERVCNPCGRKIRNLGQLFTLIKKSVNVDSSDTALETQYRDKPTAKRSLNTPEKKSPAWRCSKAKRVYSPGKNPPVPTKSKRSLDFAENAETCTSTSTVASSTIQQISALNIDDLPESGLQVKVLVVQPNGDVIVRIPQDEKLKLLVKHIAYKNWKSAANVIVKHEELLNELRQSVRKIVANEFKSYGADSESILHLNEPEDVASFTNKVLMEEVRLFCPFWYTVLLGVMRIGTKENIMTDISEINTAALATSSLIRVKNQTASAYHYRISTILFHSGTKHDDIVRLNRLGLCMSPQSIIRLQNKMNEQLEGKIKFWKKSIEDNKKTVMLCDDIVKYQIGNRETTDMEIEVTNLDVQEQTLQNYKSFSKDAYKSLMGLLDQKRNDRGDDSLTEDCLCDVIREVKTTKLPLYK